MAVSLQEAHLPGGALQVHALQVLLEAAERCLALAHRLVEARELVQHDVLVVAAGHRAAVALCGRLVALQVLVLVTVAYRHLQTQHSHIAATSF